MKKSSKKIPKTHLPKYEGGGSNFNEFGFNVEGQGQGSSTQNMYNDKRSSSKNIGQYAGYAQAAMGTANALSNINNQDYDSNTKTYAQTQAVGNGITQGIGTINPMIAMGTGIRKSATGIVGDKSGAARTASNWMAAPHESAMSDISAANNSENTQSQKLGAYGAVIGDFNPAGTKLRQMFSYGTGNDEKTTGFWGKYNDLTGISARNNQKNSLGQEFAMGGMNMQPNAEVEKQENTLNPDGSTDQYNGPSHEQGGIPTQLDPGTLIFSDKLKMGGKTFAKLNKPNMTSKEDKILSDDKASAMSKLTANLMKQAKNKSSVELFEAQESLKQSKLDNYTKRLGGIMKYPNGGITPQQYKQAQTDSTILYKSGLNPNIPNFEQNNNYTDAFLRLNALNQTPPVPLNNVDPYIRTTTSTYKQPTMIPYNSENFKKGSGVEKIYNKQKVSVNHPNYNQYVPGINQSKQPIQIEEFKKGGVKGNTYTPRVQDASESEDIIVPGTRTSSKDFNDVLAPSPYDKQMDITDANTLNKSAWEVDYMNNPNAPKPNNTYEDQGGSKFDWKGLGTQAAYFAANNAGNIYDLARANKIETRKYDRATASLLNDSAAMRDANEQTRRAEYNVRGASGGNAGTYLSNRVGLNAQNIMTKDRIRQQYANANAAISNQVNQVNTGIANEEILANAKIRANARNTKQSAIASIGSNSANQMNDVRNTNMDKKKLDGLIKMYPSLAKDPKMLEYFMSFNA